MWGHSHTMGLPCTPLAEMSPVLANKLEYKALETFQMGRWAVRDKFIWLQTCFGVTGYDSQCQHCRHSAANEHLQTAV